MDWDKEEGSPILDFYFFQMTYPRLIISLHFFIKQYIPPGFSKLLSSQLSLAQPSKDSSYQDLPILGVTRHLLINSNTHFTKGNKTIFNSCTVACEDSFKNLKKIILFWLFVIFLLEDVSNKVKYVLEASYVCYLHFLFSHKSAW